jgi:NitT/TauT family transport system substrate-binding protein
VRLVAILALLVSALALVAGGCGGGEEEEGGGQPAAPQEAEAKPIRIGFSTWVGYIPIVIASKEGFFEEQGVKVEYTVIEDPVQRFNALKTGELDAVATTVDTFARTLARGIDSVQVLGLDASTGGDGIVASKDTKTVKDLKGEKVGVSEGSVSQFFLAYVLRQNGMSLDDVQQVDMTSADAGAAFAAGRIPVAVTWEPWLSRAEKNPEGHVLVSSEEYPEIIVDTVGFRPDFARDNAESVNAFIRGYVDAMELIESDPDKAYENVTDYLGQSPDEIEATLETIKLFTLEDNVEFLGTDEKPGPVFETFEQAAQFWKDIGETTSIPDAKKAIDPTFVQEMAGGS